MQKKIKNKNDSNTQENLMLRLIITLKCHLQLQQMTFWNYIQCIYFSEKKKGLNFFHVNCLPTKQFTWHVKPFSLSLFQKKTTKKKTTKKNKCHMLLCTWLFWLTFTNLWANSADDNFMIFFSYFLRKENFIFHANCLHRIGDSLHKMSKPVFREKKKKKKNLYVVCQKFYPDC